VGLADTEVKEARERVRAALQNSGLAFPHNKRIRCTQAVFRRNVLSSRPCTWNKAGDIHRRRGARHAGADGGYLRC
jgi:hypothetical protein